MTGPVSPNPDATGSRVLWTALAVMTVVGAGLLLISMLDWVGYTHFVLSLVFAR